MARCSCGNASCSCIVKAAEGGGAIVVGNGSPTRPYLISLESGGNALDNIVFDSTPSLALHTVGAGTPAEMMHVSGVATPKLTELRDVLDASGPANGEVPVWRTDHWQFEAQTGSGGGAGLPPAFAAYSRKAALSFAVSTQVPIPWDTVESAATGITFNGTTDFTIQYAGTYLITCSMYFTAAVNTGYSQVRIIKNGAIYDYNAIPSDDTINYPCVLSRQMKLAVGDVIQIAAYCNPAGSLTVTPTFNTNALQIVRLDAASGAATDPPLPDPVDTYVGGDQTITTTTGGTETPTQVRATIVNPNPTRRLLVEVVANSRGILGGTLGGVYYGVKWISGGSNAVPVIETVFDTTTTQAVMKGQLFAWVAAGGTAVFGVYASKYAAGSSYLIRYTHNSIIPIRYE